MRARALIDAGVPVSNLNSEDAVPQSIALLDDRIKHLQRQRVHLVALADAPHAGRAGRSIAGPLAVAKGLYAPRDAGAFLCRRGRAIEVLQSAVYFPPVSHADYENHQYAVLNPVNHPVVSHPNASLPVASDQLSRSRRLRIGGQIVDCPIDPLRFCTVNLAQ